MNVQTIELFLPISSDIKAINKAITRSSNQSHLTCPQHDLSMLKTVSKVDDSDHLALASRWSGDKLNSKCMTKQDWVEVHLRTKQLVK